MKKATLFFVLLAALGLAGLALANKIASQEKKFEGNIVIVDVKNQTFSVKSETEEMTFHLSPESELTIDGQRRLVSELAEGEHVTVAYKLQDMRNIPLRVNKHVVEELLGVSQTFEGNVVAVDLKAHTFTVREMLGDHVKEMKFHVGQSNHILIDGQRALLSQMENGDHVVVTYTSEGDQHRVEQLKRHSKKAS